MKTIIEAQNFTLAKYFKRISIADRPSPTISFVKQMMRQHIYTIPFENLDVQAGKIVSLIPEEFVSKIIDNNRGGYCYEMNGLFTLALQALNIECYFAAARPMFYPTKRPRTHMIIIAKIEDKKFLIDVGFGSHGIRQPMSLDSINKVIKQDYDYYKIIDQDDEFIMQALVNKEWISQYSFKMQSCDFIDFMPANFLNSKHPEAIFVKAPLIILYNPDGRKVLFGNSIKYYSKGSVTEKIFSEENYKEILDKEFNLKLP